MIHNKIFGEDPAYVATSYRTQRGISVQQFGRLQPSQRTLQQSTDILSFAVNIISIEQQVITWFDDDCWS